MKNLILGVMGLSLLSCSIEPAEIEYGFDACHFCQMTIVDKTHASMLVTDKGKSQKYDAIECMVRDMNRGEKKEYAFILVTDYLSPGKLVDVKSCKFLISESIPSPMGANLSAFDKKEDVQKMLSEGNGDLYTWQEIKNKFN